jgi:hypothetical protein
MNDKYYQNLFNANHRAAMIRAYGWTEAMFIKIEDLIEDLIYDR